MDGGGVGWGDWGILGSKFGSQVVMFSWSGGYYTTGPWMNDWGGSPVPLDPLFKAWDDSTPVVLRDVVRTLQQVTGAWDHEPHPSAVYTGNGSVPLSESVLISWLVRGCLHWEARISGPLSVDLPVWMEDPAEEVVVVHVRAGEVVEESRGYHVWVQADPPPDQDVSRYDFLIPVTWTVGLPWGLSGPLRRELDQCLLP